MSMIFNTMSANGTIIHNRTISRESMLACPYTIMMPDHYRDDQSCRCDDPGHLEMIEWEYKWNGTKWIPAWDE